MTNNPIIHLLTGLLALSSIFTTPVQAAEELLIDAFEGTVGTTWEAQSGSEIDTISQEATKDGAGGLKWTFRPDGVNRYGNEVVAAFTPVDVTQFKALRFDFKINGEIAGRIGCQIVNTAQSEVIDLGDIHELIAENEWTEVVLPIPSDIQTPIDGLKLFFDGIVYTDSTGLVCHADNFRFTVSETEGDPSQKVNVPPIDASKAEPAFSQLPAAEQVRLRLRSAPKPLAERINPYSALMYYPQWGGSSPDGTQRSDLQEALIREFAELGMSKLHYYAYPTGIGTQNPNDIDFRLSEADKVGTSELVRLCRKYGLKIGMRVDLPYILVPERNRPEHSDPATSYWQSNPRNPDNQLALYTGWLRELVTLLKGDLEYIIVGDELTDSGVGLTEAWTKQDQMDVLKLCSAAIWEIDPKVLVSGFAASSGKIGDVIEMVKMGYGKYANAVAINHYDSNVVSDFLRKLKEADGKDFPLLSNGVGYISSDTTPRNPPKDPYSRYTDADQASMIARTMYSWWNNQAFAAPYYVPIRSIDYKGKAQPLWYGFFGFMDFIVDQNDIPSFKRYPGWYAYQTIANVFDDRPSFKESSVSVTPSNQDKLYFQAFEREGRDLTIILWREDRRKVPVDISIASQRYKHPVQIDLMNHETLKDTPYQNVGNQTILRNIETGFRPTIVRLFAE